MATPTVKTTYTLDLETVSALEALAKRWNVSKSEAMRRAIRASALVQAVSVPSKPLQALNELQGAIRLAPSAAARWSRGTRGERHAGSRQREGRGR